MKTTRYGTFETNSSSTHSLLILSDEIRNTWSIIRSKIFNNVLMKDTTPKEALASIKLGYYSFIIRPLVKLLENEYYDQYSEEKNFIINNSKKAFKHWLEAEKNIVEAEKNTKYEHTDYSDDGLNDRDIEKKLLLNLKRKSISFPLNLESLLIK